MNTDNMRIEKIFTTKGFIFKKQKVTYIVKDDERVYYHTHDENDAERYKRDIIKYYNAPMFIIEKNGLEKYRIKQKCSINLHYSDVIDYSILQLKEDLNSLQEAEDFISNMENKSNWEKVKEIK